VHYTLNAADPTLADEVQFNVDTAPVAGSTLRAQLVDGGDWFDCVNTGTLVECDTTDPQANVFDTDQLRVVIAQ
jgi:hypothetical protein